LDTASKPLPIDYLKSLPVDIRIQHFSWGPATFTYEEYPKQGDKTGYLKIERCKGQIQPFFNKPEKDDPAYLTLNAEGSLMGSGTVETQVEMPLHNADPYKVQGAFRNLDLTSLNPSAVNLGDLRLESGMLNDLIFNFDMNGEKATGKIVGEYHDLVADKLKDIGGKKEVAGVKTFFLQKLIVPRDKDHTLPVSRRSGKVNYARDPQRYFSYYMLHSLLVGVKDSFSLGVLLPG
jgi:hypothetical protein